MHDQDRSPKDRAAKFIGALRHKCTDRGSRAALRRGLSPATVMDAWPVVAALGGEIGFPGESAYVDIAALYAIHPEESGARDFGETCRRVAHGTGKEIPESYERRFRRLLACSDAPAVLGQLRSWIRLAANNGVGVNYTKLLIDLINWPRFGDDIRVQWARSFWQASRAAPADGAFAVEATAP